MWEKEYIDLLLGNKVQECLELKFKNFPQKLYRYMAVSENSIRCLENDTVWVSSASKMNDLYDSFFAIDKETPPDIKVDKDDFIKYISKYTELSSDDIVNLKKSENVFKDFNDLVINRYPERQKDLRNQIRIIESIGDDLTEKYNNRMVKYFTDVVKICCFSEVNDNLLMWSHYANNHKGICIEYDYGALPNADIRKRLLSPILYTDVLFNPTDFFSGEKEVSPFVVLAASLQKSRDWEYEREWRLVFAHGDWGKDSECLAPTPTSIYIGPKCSLEDRSKIIAIALEKRIRVLEMKQNLYNYKLESSVIAL